MTNDPLIKGAEAASEYLGGVVTRQQIYNLAAKGEIPSIKKMGRLYFRAGDLDRAFSAEQAQ